MGDGRTSLEALMRILLKVEALLWYYQLNHVNPVDEYELKDVISSLELERYCTYDTYFQRLA